MPALMTEPSAQIQWRSEGCLLQVLDALPAAAYTCDLGGLITYYNGRAVDVWGRAPRLNDALDRYCGSFRLFDLEGRPVPHDRCWMALALREGRAFDACEIVIERPNGARRSALAHANPLRGPDGRLIGAVNVLVDITEMKRAEERLAHQATHDALTGLPNRALLLRQLDRAIATAEHGGVSFGLLLLDLDRFKEINDTHGHHVGDAVLQYLRPLLQGAVREGDTVARLGGDEFGILLPGADADRAMAVGRRILEVVRRPLRVEEQTFDVGVSIGVALFPDHGREAMTLLKRADVAMYAAKRGRSGVVFYRDDQAAVTPRHLALATELRSGLDQDELVLHYQPKIDLRTLRPRGAEALVRWLHPLEGLLPPAEFIPVAEHTGLIRPLGLWTLRAALRQGLEWRHLGRPLDISINLAPDNLQDGPLIDAMVALLAAGRDLPMDLTIEVTESAVMDDPARAREALDRLHDLGVRISIDDFGTGYSSLAHLKELPVDEVKIDRSFVSDMTRSDQDACIVRAVIDLGHNLGLTVVAEGVEDEESLDLLRDWGCDQAQGYLFSRPLPPADFARWLTSAPSGYETRRVLVAG